MSGRGRTGGNAVSGAGISANGLTLTVPAFSVGDYSHPGGTLTAIPNITQYVCAHLHTKRLHVLRRAYDQGVIVLGKVVAGASTVTTTTSQTPQLPITRIPRALAKIRAQQSLLINLMGSSLVAATESLPNTWGALVLDYQSAQAGYGLPAGAPVAYIPANQGNFAVGGWNSYSASAQSNPASGPDSLPCVQFTTTTPGGQTLDIATPLGVAAVTMRARAVGGSVQARIKIGTRQNAFICYTGDWVTLTDTVNPVTISATSSTQMQVGVTGVRVYVEMQGGTVQINQVSCTVASKAGTISNFAVGGQGTKMHFAQIAGRAAKLLAAASGVVGVPAGNARSSAGNADLVIIESTANRNGTSESLWQATIAAALATGAEVIAVTGNPFNPAVNDPGNTNYNTWASGDAFARLAQSMGVAVCDTAAYVYEGYDKGITVYADSIHSSATTPAGASAAASASGNECWAEAISGLLSHTLQQQALPQVYQPRLPGGAQVPGAARITLPVDLTFSSGSGTLAARDASLSTYISLAETYGAASGQAQMVLTSGARILVGHPMLMGLLLATRQDVWAADVYLGAAFVKSISQASAGSGSLSMETVLDTTDIATPTNAVYEIRVTSGTLRVLGAVALTPAYEPATVAKTGTWANDTVLGMSIGYTDTATSIATATGEGRSLVLVLGEGAAGGSASRYDGGAVQTAESLVAASTGYRSTWYSPGRFATHNTQRQLASAGSSPVAGNRSLAVAQAFAVLDR